MRKVIVLGSVVALVALSTSYLASRTEPVSHENSPAFQALLTEAVAGLEGVPTQISATSVAEARAEGQLATTEYRCGYTAAGNTHDGTPTCTGQYTCDDSETCFADGWTCYNSTCSDFAQTCDGTFGCYQTFSRTRPANGPARSPSLGIPASAG
jgi:hypothetical protein